HSLCSPSLLFVSYCSCAPRDLHPFPTRRSSDLSGWNRTTSNMAAAGDGWAMIADPAQGPHTMAIVFRHHSRTRPCRRGGFTSRRDRKSTRLNSSHVKISYAVFCLKKKKIQNTRD